MVPANLQSTITANDKRLSFGWIRLFTLSAGLLWAYLLLALFLGVTIVGFHVRLLYLAPIIVVSVGVIYWLTHWLNQRQWLSADWLKGLTVASGTMLLSFLALDTSYRIYLNTANPDVAEDFTEPYYRLTDQRVWYQEQMPRHYHPTEKNFTLYKPNVRLDWIAYGGNYYSKLKQIPIMVSSVLEPRHIRYSIDEHGFRDTTPPDQARIFALGDSFTVGLGITQDRSWVELFEHAMEEPVYNLGIRGTSPKQQLMLLQHLLRTKGDSFKIRHLLWMIYEVNDLEDSYGTLSGVHKAREGGFTGHDRGTLASVFKGTLLDTLASIPAQIGEQSAINQFMKARIIRLASLVNDPSVPDPYFVDGVRLVYPLYHSPRHGYRMFPMWTIERAQKSQSYVLDHPNRPLLDQTFEEMASLSRMHGFKVTILIAPGAARLYAPYFEGFPQISDEPHFINYVQETAEGLGFDVINLYTKMKPYARKALLYWRDDLHWNVRGNEVVAEIISKHPLFRSD